MSKRIRMVEQSDPELVAALVRYARNRGSNFNFIGAARALGLPAAAARKRLRRPRFILLVAEADSRAAQLLQDCIERARRRQESQQRGQAGVSSNQTADYVRKALREGLALPEDACYDAPLPDVPTAAMPGTPAKVDCMALRASLFQSLFHPSDAKPSLGAVPIHGQDEQPRRNMARPRGERAA